MRDLNCNFYFADSTERSGSSMKFYVFALL